MFGASRLNYQSESGSLMLSQFDLQLLGPSPHHPSATSLSVSLLLLLRLLVTFTAMHLPAALRNLPPRHLLHSRCSSGKVHVLLLLLSR
jgi:hypothetical protein